MKHIIILFALILCASPSFSQGVKWGHTFGSEKNLSSNYVQYIQAVEFYGQETVYAIGRFQDTLFVGTDTVLSKDGQMWLSKIDTSGHIHWTKSFLKTISQSPNGVFGEVYVIKADPVENCIYIGGYLQPSSYLFGADTLSFSTNYREFFIAKLDTSGNPIWGKTSNIINASTLPTHHVSDIDITAEGGIAITGFCSGTREWLGDTIDLGIRGGGFVTKMDKHGNKQWTIPLESQYDTQAKSVQTNPDSSIVISGMFNSNLTIDTLQLYSGSGSKVFYARIDKDGNPLWGFAIANTNNVANLYSSDLFKRGQHIYSAFSMSSQTNIADINQTITPNNQGTIVVVKMDRYSGKISKAIPLPTSQYSTIPRVFVDRDETNIHLISEFGGSVLQNGITYTQGVNLTNIDSSGTIICNFPLNTSITPYGRSHISGNNSGHLVIGSTLQNSRTLANVHLDDFGTQRSFLLSTDEDFCGDIGMPIGSTDICERDSLLVSAPAGYNSYAWSNGDSSSSTYFHQGGLHYCYFTDTNGLYYISQSFELNEAISGISKYILGDSAVCPNDSLIISADSSWSNVIWNGIKSGNSLKIDTAGLYYFTAHDPLFPTCTFYSDTFQVYMSTNDSIAILNIPDSICRGDSVLINLFFSNTIDTNTFHLNQNGRILSIQNDEWLRFDSLGNNTLSAFAQNIYGCNFSTLSDLIMVIDTPMAQITQRADTLFSNMQFGNQWLKNDTILTDTLDYYVIKGNGIYTLKVHSDLGCSSTDQINIGNVNLDNPFNGEYPILLYPNPTTGKIFIELTSELATGNKLYIHDSQGSQMMVIKLEATKQELNLDVLSPGLYIIKFKNNFFKLQKN
ncbi:T9SS type A sorting domain-containing protein [Owenweeksia hongkongensis]|uniref:T9SS type A sorting domain-containing protein n=1 Tax=Owenweeksia hongkongensis TaxID=253245 RepID=UPI003A8EE1B6